MTIETGDLPVVVDNSHAAAATQAQGAYEKFFQGSHGNDPAKGSMNDMVRMNGQGSDQNWLRRTGDDNDPTVIDGSHFHFPDISSLFGTPTKEEVSDAEKQFDKKISGMIPGADQDLLKKVGHAMLEGNPEALAAALKDIHDPEKLKAVVKEMNRMMKDLGTDAELAIGPGGHVLMYSKTGSVAIEIDPAKGQVVGERPIEVHGNTVILKDGTVLNGDVDGDAKTIGNGAVGSIEHPTKWWDEPYHPFRPISENPDEPKWWPFKPAKPGLFPDDKPWYLQLQKRDPNIELL